MGMKESPSPFCLDTPCAVVAKAEGRAGYVQFASPSLSTTFATLPPVVLQVAHAWACQLEQWPNVERVYWFLLSEQVRHLHYHLFPRFANDTLRGTALFDARFEASHSPEWTQEQRLCLEQFCHQHHVALLPPTP